MNSMLKCLTEDQKNIMEALYNLGREINAYSGESDEAPDVDAVLDLLDYIKVYPRIWLHPMENIIYETLLDKEVSSFDLVEDLITEHNNLEILIDYLHQVFSTRSLRRGRAAAKLVKETNEFIKRQLKHIKREQSECHPLVEKLLTDEDCESIHRQFVIQIKTTGEKKWKEYQSLFSKTTSSMATVSVC